MVSSIVPKKKKTLIAQTSPTAGGGSITSNIKGQVTEQDARGQVVKQAKGSPGMPSKPDQQVIIPAGRGKDAYYTVINPDQTASVYNAAEWSSLMQAKRLGASSFDSPKVQQGAEMNKKVLADQQFKAFQEYLNSPEYRLEIRKQQELQGQTPAAAGTQATAGTQVQGAATEGTEQDKGQPFKPLPVASGPLNTFEPVPWDETPPPEEYAAEGMQVPASWKVKYYQTLGPVSKLLSSFMGRGITGRIGRAGIQGAEGMATMSKKAILDEVVSNEAKINAAWSLMEGNARDYQTSGGLIGASAPETELRWNEVNELLSQSLSDLKALETEDVAYYYVYGRELFYKINVIQTNMIMWARTLNGIYNNMPLAAPAPLGEEVPSQTNGGI